MDSLPTETLIPILRFLPPKTFYTQIPLVCRRFRDAAAVAVPGLNAAEVGVACDLRVCEYLGTMRNSEHLKWNKTFYACDGPTGPMWTGLKCHVNVDLHRLAKGLDEDELIQLIEQGEYPVGSVTLPTLKLHWIEANLFCTYYRTVLDETYSRGFQNFWDFVQSHRMRHFNINVNTSICQALQGVSGRVQMTHVRHVSLRRTTGVAWVELEAMLELFPNVEFLSGGAFIDAVSAAHLIERISDHRRRRITKFERLILHPELRPYLFVETPRVFPNLRELGTLAIWGGDEMWMDDVAFDWRGAGPLHSIQTFSILVFAADLLAAPSTDRFVILAGSIFELMPGITTLKITIDMVMPTRGYDEVPGSDVAVVLQFLEDLLRVGKRQSQTLRARLELLSPGHGMKKLFELPGSVHEVKRTFGRDFQTLARNAGVSLCTEERYVFDDTRD